MPQMLKSYKWQVIIKKRPLSYPNFYWIAICDDDPSFEITNSNQYGSSKSAKENFRIFAKREGITKYEYI